MAVFVEVAATKLAGVAPEAGTDVSRLRDLAKRSAEIGRRAIARIEPVTVGTTRTRPIAPEKVYWFCVAVTSVAPAVAGPFHPVKKLGLVVDLLVQCGLVHDVLRVLHGNRRRAGAFSGCTVTASLATSSVPIGMLPELFLPRSFAV